MKGPVYERIFVLHAIIAILWLVHIPILDIYWPYAMVTAHALLPVCTYWSSRHGSRWVGLLLGHGGLILVYAGLLVAFVIEHWSYPYTIAIALFATGLIVAYGVYCMVVVAILKRLWPPHWSG